MAELAHDVLEKILIGMDVKDLIRCKSVCKSWHSFISSSRFIKSHLNQSYNNDNNNNDKLGHRRILMYWSKCGISDKNGIYLILGDRYHLLGSSNGLVCIYTSKSDIFIANPLTRDVKKVQIPKMIVWSCLCWGFGYDSATDDYKIILGIKKGRDLTCFQVFSLYSNDWKVVGEVKYTINYKTNTMISTFYNGALHWFMNDENNKNVILSFHLSKHEFKEIAQPDNERYRRDITVYTSMGIIKNCLCIFNAFSPTLGKWVMKKYNVKQSWELVTYDVKRENHVLHCLKKMKDYIPQESFCDHVYTAFEYIGSPIFVRSLVSPHGNGRLKRNRQAMNSNSIKRDPSVHGSRARG